MKKHTTQKELREAGAASRARSQPLSGAAQPEPQTLLQRATQFWIDTQYEFAFPRNKDELSRLMADFAERVLTTDAAPVAVPAANFVSDQFMPSCHVCGEMMKGVCPKCGTETGVAVPAGPRKCEVGMCQMFAKTGSTFCVHHHDSCSAAPPAPLPPPQEPTRDWRSLPIGHWFFVESPDCTNRYSVQERTDGGCVLICSTPWHHSNAKRDMQEIADAHNRPAALAGETRQGATVTARALQDIAYWLKWFEDAWRGEMEMRKVFQTAAETAEAALTQAQQALDDEHSSAVSLLCGNHAQTWYTMRNTIKTKSGCVFCDAEAQKSALMEAIEPFATNSEMCSVRDWWENAARVYEQVKQGGVPIQNSIDQFQLRMTAWGIRCFGQDHMDDPVIRGMRLLEEAIEFAQAVGVTQVTASALISYVYGREAGNPEQELGGVAVTLMACASALKRKLSEIIMDEIIRVESKGEKHFTERNQIKRDLGFK